METNKKSEMRNSKWRFLSVMLTTILGGVGYTQTVDSYTTAGTYSWTAPCGVTEVTVEVWGGGGAGGGATRRPAGGGGGAGGGYVKRISYPVTPGTSYTVYVGSGGAGSSGSSGGNGKASYFVSSTTIKAVGGNGGSASTSSNFSASGATATTTGNLGFTASFSYYGGSGGTGSSGTTGGGGGSSAGTSSDGNAGVGATAGSAVSGGGAGGNAGSNGNGVAGSAPGAGGGGCQRTSSGSGQTGGNGAAGKIVLTYTINSSSPGNVTSLTGSEGDADAQISFVTPSCIDEVMIVAKNGSSISTTPSGNGSSYTANTIFGSGSSFDGGYVVYKGLTSPQTITGLTNGNTYYIKVFSRSGTNWSSGAEISIIPNSAYYWNGSSISANPAAGGSGTWSTANAWRYPSSYGAQATWTDGASNLASFQGTGGTVTLSGNVTLNTALVKVANYSFVSDGTTNRVITGSFNLSSGINMKLNNSTSTSNRSLSVSGNFSGASDAILTLHANQVSGNYSKLSLTGSSSQISIPVRISTGSNTTSYGNVSISGEGTNTSILSSADILNNSSYKLSLGATTGNQLTIGSVISGSGDVVFASGVSGGDGTVVLNANNTYTGTSTLYMGTNGILKIGIDNAIPTASRLTITAGTFDLNGNDQELASLSGSSGGKILNNGATLSTLEISGTNSTTFGRVIADGTAALKVIRSGTGTTTFSGASTYSGGTVLNGGVFAVGASSTGSAGSVTSGPFGISTITMSGGGIATSGTTGRTILNNYILAGDALLGDVTNNGNLTFSGGGTISGGNGSMTLNSNVTISGVINSSSNTYGFAKQGSGILTLSGANTFLGDLVLTEGATKIAANATGSAGNVTSGPLGRGNLVLDGGSISSSSTTARTIYNNFQITNPSIIGDATNNGVLTFSGAGTLASDSSELNVASSVTISGVMSDGGAGYSFIKSGSSTLTLTGASTYTGKTIVSAGTLQLNKTGGNTLASTSSVEISGGILKVSSNQTINNLNVSAGTLQVDAGVTLTINGSFSGGGTIANSGTIVLVGTTNFPGSSSTISAMNNLQINSSGTVTLDKDLAVSGTLTLTSGQFNLSNYSLTINGAYPSGTIDNIKTTSGSSLILNCTGTSTVSLPNFTAIKDLTINTASRIYNFNSDPTISGTIVLTNGTLSLNGKNVTFAGANITKTSGVIDASGTGSTFTFGNSSAFFIPSGIFSSTIYNLAMNGSGSATFGENSTVTNSLDLSSGTLGTGAYTFTFNGSTITRSSGVLDVSNSAATLSLANSSLLTLPNGMFASSINNLTINNARVKSNGDFTVNGVLNLNASNPDATNGLLDLVQNYGSYADVHSTNSTDSYNNLDSKVLTLGTNATVTGTGDVTGKIRRTSFTDGATYAFGNPNMRLTFNQNGGTLPSQITVVATKGTEGIHVDKDGVSDYTPGAADTLIGGAAVKRMHQILRTGGTSAVRFTVRFPYNESELNGNSETDLVTWDHHLPYGGMTPHEHGKTAQNTTENWVELSNHGLFYIAEEGDAAFTKYWMLSKKVTKDTLWLGGATSSWTNASNWSSGTIPSNWTKIIIDKALYNNELVLTGSQQAATMYIKSGAVVRGGSSTLTLNGGPAINGGSGTWVNDGLFIPESSTVVINNSDATLSGNTNFYNLTINSGKKATIQANTTDTISGVLTNSGTLDATANDNKIVFNGTNQTISNPNGVIAGFHDLEIAQTSGTAVADENLTVNGNLVLSNGTFDPNGKTISIKGDLQSNASMTSSGKISMIGTNATITGSVVPSFYKLEINSGTTTLSNDITVDSSLVLLSGSTLNASSNTIELKAAGTPLKNNGTFNAGTSNVVYNTGGTTLIAPINYYTLEAKGVGQKNLSGVTNATSIIVDNSILGLNSQTLRFSGNGSNVSLLNGGKMDATSGKLLFEHSGSAFHLDSASFTGDISKLELNSTQDLILDNNITIADSLLLNAGTLNIGNEFLTVGTNGKMDANGGVVSTNTGGIVFKAQDLDVAAIPTGSLNFLEINRPSGSVNINGDLEVAGELKVSNGTLNLGANKLTISGTILYGSGNIDATSGTIDINNSNDLTIPSGIFTSSVKEFTTRGAGKITLAQPITVSDKLNIIAGEITTSNTNILEVGSSATQPGEVFWTDGNINGPLKRWFAASTNSSQESGIFPLGNAGLNKFAQVNFTTAPEGGYIIAEYKLGLPSNPYNFPLSYTESSTQYFVQNADEEGYWDITPYSSGGTAYGALDNTPYNLKLRINNPTSVQNGGVLTNPPRLRLIRAKGSLSGHGSWQMAGTFATVTELNSGVDYLVESNNVSGFSWFNAGGDNSNPLPVELLSFNANCNENGVLVKWSTASENRSDYFEIQSSENGVDWSKKATLPAAGFSTQLLNYSFQDENVLRGSNRYYQLIQYDKDGVFKQYDPILVNCGNESLTVTTYPNPSGQNGFNINIQDNESQKWTMIVQDMKGIVVENQTFTSNIGATNIIVTKKWSKGIYMIHLQNEKGETTIIRQCVE